MTEVASQAAMHMEHCNAESRSETPGSEPKTTELGAMEKKQAPKEALDKGVVSKGEKTADGSSSEEEASKEKEVSKGGEELKDLMPVKGSSSEDGSSSEEEGVTKEEGGGKDKVADPPDPNASAKDSSNQNAAKHNVVEPYDYEESVEWTYSDPENRMALYETAVHGPPLVGATIVRYEDTKIYVDFAYPSYLNNVKPPDEPVNFQINDHNSWSSTDLDVEKELKGCFHLVPRLALGAMLDTTLVDFVYFTLPTPSGNYLYGISYVAKFQKEKETNQSGLGSNTDTEESYNIPTNVPGDQTADDNTPNAAKVITKKGFTAREYRNTSAYFVAICVISKVPFFCYIGCKLEYIAQTYFHTKCFSDYQLLLSFVEQMNSKECVENWSYEALYFSLETYFKPLTLCLTYRALLFMVKCIMVGRKILVYSECAGRTTTAVLSLLTLIPGANALGFNSKGFGSLWHSWKKFGMPLHLFHSKNVIFPYFTPEMSCLLDDVNGYLIGITDREVLKLLKKRPDMVLNLEMNCVQLFNKKLLEVYHPSMYEIDYFDTLMDDFDASEDELMKSVADTGEAIYNSISGYLAKAPSTLINIGSTLKRYVNRRGNERRPIGCNESALGLLDKYFPGSVPGWLKKCAISKSASSRKSKNKHSGESPHATTRNVEIYEPKAFTVQDMFNKMACARPFYQYLGYFENIQRRSNERDRNLEIEYAINNFVNPMHNYLLKFLEEAAYVCGERRVMYQLLLDFEFDLQALTDCSQRVMGMVLKRGNIYLRGDLPEEEEPGILDTLLNFDFGFDCEDSVSERNGNTGRSSVSKEAPKDKATEKQEMMKKKKDKDSAGDKNNTRGMKFPTVNKETIAKVGSELVSRGKNALSGGVRSTSASPRNKADGNNAMPNKVEQTTKMDNTKSDPSPSIVKRDTQGESSERDEKDSPMKETHHEQQQQVKREDTITNELPSPKDETKPDSNKGILEDVAGTEPTPKTTVTEDDDKKQSEATVPQDENVRPKDEDKGNAPTGEEKKHTPSERIRSVGYDTRQPGDEEINIEVTATIATRIMELQNNHSLEFLERWLRTVCAKKFFDEHTLNVFNEPVYLANSSMVKHKYPNGDVYIGELVHLQREGKGTYIAADGTQYEGDWVAGMRQGHGTLISNKQGYKYTGEWHNDKREGEGQLTTPLFEYTGTFKCNQFNGRGKLVHKGGSTYEGDFENGKYSGRGRLTLPDGTIKIGSFRDNELYGVCSVIRSDGRIYVGKLHGEVLSGKGRLIYNRLVSFEGQWDEGIREGQGVVEIKLSEDDSDGIITIEGVWNKDNLCMNEVMVKFPNGYKYVGTIAYCSDLSQLMYTSSYDESLHTKSEEAMMTCDNRILPHGHGIIKTASGSNYSGELLHGMRFGKGDIFFSNGVSYRGEWAFGTMHGEAEVTFPDNPEPRKVTFKYGCLTDTLEGKYLQLINECLEDVGGPGLEREFTLRNLEPCPGLLTATAVTVPPTGQYKVRSSLSQSA